MKARIQNTLRYLTIGLLWFPTLWRGASAALVPTHPARATCPITLSVSVVDNKALCAGKPAQLMASVPATPFGNWYWTKDSKKLGFDQQTYLTITESGVYSLGGDWQSNPCFTAPTALTVSFNPADAITVVLSPPSVTLCEGEEATLTAQAGYLTGYHWTRNGTEVPNSLNKPALPVREAGVYSLTGTFATCTDIKNGPVVTVNARPTLSLTPSRLTLCEGETAQLDAQTNAANAPNWRRNGADLGPTRSLTANSAATYSLTATSAAGCSQTLTYAYSPVIYSIPVFKLAPAPPDGAPGVSPSTAPLDPTYRYEWSPTGGVSDPTAARPLFSPLQTTLYTLTIRNEGGCEHTDTLRIPVRQRLHLATAFSPNGDGLNDTWEPINFANYPDAEVLLFGRSGELIYSAKPGQPPFDGRQNGEPLPGGTYAYRIRFASQPTEWRGTLLLLR